MRAVCLDIGEVRIGIAATDASGRIASPVKVLPAAEVLHMASSFRRIIDDCEPDVLVCGLPKTLAGERGPQAERVEAQARELARACGLPLEFADERLSSGEAKRILREQGLSERDMRGKVDMIAASLILESWLESKQRAEGPLDGEGGTHG